jgi:UDP-N-acetylglucosamine--N-acetylmuramyl-(pentapeptide) pyrophosphoryl-undecaprenol N-acetylglucosamine transferase
VKLAVAGGGTGGHLFPGLAVADLARDQAVASEIVFFGAERGIEARIVPARGYDLVAQPLEGMRGRSPRVAARALARLAGAIRAAGRELRHREIDVVLGLGGYASASAVVAARLRGIPVVLMEQNREPGMSNRLLSRMAVAVCTSFDDTATHFPSGLVRLTGNPVRGDLEGVRYQRDAGGLLVCGGSGGARTLNRAVAAALVRLAGVLELPPILHQTGEQAHDEISRLYESAGLQVDVRPFIDDMAEAYGNARLAICRSGATTIAELEATAMPSVLVPFPHAAGDHQTVNARALEEAGAARVVLDDVATAERLYETVHELLGRPEELDSMSARAGALYRPGAAAAVLEVLQAAVRPNRR